LAWEHSEHGGSLFTGDASGIRALKVVCGMRTPWINSQQLATAGLLAALVLLGAGCTAPDISVPTESGASGRAGVQAAWPVSAADLHDGLLGAEAASAGFVPVTSADDEDGARAVFKGAGCRELARWLNGEKMPGSRAEAAVALSSTADGGAAAEQLYAMDSPHAAAQVVDRYRRAAMRCTTITLSVAGVGTSVSPVHPISLVEEGDTSFATKVSAASADSFTGEDIIHVATHAGPIVIAVTVMGAHPSAAETVARAAVQRVRDISRTGTPQPPRPHQSAGPNDR
jgi:hypothetical protein